MKITLFKDTAPIKDKSIINTRITVRLTDDLARRYSTLGRIDKRKIPLAAREAISKAITSLKNKRA